MDREEIAIRDRIKRLLEVYEIEDILAEDDMTIEDMLFTMVMNYGLNLPDYEPL